MVERFTHEPPNLGDTEITVSLPLATILMAGRVVGSSLVKKGFSNEVMAVLDEIGDCEGGKKRNEIAAAIISQFEVYLCQTCALVTNCSKIKPRKSFGGEVFPEMSLNLCEVTDCQVGNCFKNV